jgi:hypothetical protein
MDRSGRRTNHWGGQIRKAEVLLPWFVQAAGKSEKLQSCCLSLFRQRTNQKNCSPAALVCSGSGLQSLHFFTLYMKGFF